MYVFFWMFDGWSVIKLTGLCVRSWAALGVYVGGLGAVFGSMLAISGRFGAAMGGPGPLSGPMLAVLGRSWGLSSQSWAAIGA
jgi:hypothetical protein